MRNKSTERCLKLTKLFDTKVYLFYLWYLGTGGGGDNIGENCVVFDCGSELYDLQLSEFCPKIIILHGSKGIFKDGS